VVARRYVGVTAVMECGIRTLRRERAAHESAASDDPIIA
jgi:hypothetical protein